MYYIDLLISQQVCVSLIVMVGRLVSTLQQISGGSFLYEMGIGWIILSLAGTLCLRLQWTTADILIFFSSYCNTLPLIDKASRITLRR